MAVCGGRQLFDGVWPNYPTGLNNGRSWKNSEALNNEICSCNSQACWHLSLFLKVTHLPPVKARLLIISVLSKLIHHLLVIIKPALIIIVPATFYQRCHPEESKRREFVGERLLRAGSRPSSGRTSAWRRSNTIAHYTGWLTVPPNFQCQNENRWAANQRFCFMKFSMYKRSSLVEQRFSF